MSRKDEYAREVLRAGQDLNITPRGIVIAYATVYVESNWIMWANAKVPESMKIPHERVGSDGFSVGLFQQQVVWGNGWWWGDAATCMDPYKSARLFFDRLKARDYNHGDPGAHAQAVQRSSFPDRYGQRMAEAQRLYDRIAGTTTPPPQGPWRGDPIWLPDVLRAEGLECDIYPGAFNRGHGDFGEIWGVMAHHTGSNPPSNNPGYIAQHPTLGLASQLHLSRSGKYTLCGVGIAWHAGRGSYPGLPTNDANRLTIGIEAENNGTEGWSHAQYSAYVKGCAAILRRLGHNSSRLIGHKEWAGASQGKWDPGGIDMDVMRADVQAQIDTRGDDPLSNPDIIRKINELHSALCGDERSRSIYADPDPGTRGWSAAQQVRNLDANDHARHVEAQARRGSLEHVGLIVRTAKGKGYYTDADSVARATRALRTIPDDVLQAWEATQ